MVGLGEREEAEVVAAAAALDVALVPLGQLAVRAQPPALVLGFSRLPEPTLAEAAHRLHRALG
jgi:DNA-binding transcriptional MocR family regulator